MTINVAAVDGYDYVNMSPDEIFTSGSIDNATRCVNISILDDDSLEGDQTFTLTLTSVDFIDVMLGTDMTTITIVDNDGGGHNKCSIVLYVYIIVCRCDCVCPSHAECW